MTRRTGWIVRLAWRDARATPQRLLLFVLTIVTGVAALVAVRSFADNLASAVDDEAKVLLGADLEISGRGPFGVEAEALVAGIGGDQARQVALGSMAYFPDSGGSRLVGVRAVDDGYPFYGTLVTQPALAARAFRSEQSALVDHTLMLQFGVEVGDPVRIGELTFRVAGRLMRIPGEIPTASLVGPRVFIPRRFLEGTRLIRGGSRATFSTFFRLDRTPEQVAELIGEIEPQLRDLQLEGESVQFRREAVGDALEDLYAFLYLAGFAALLLGGIGVASAIHLHVKSKLRAVAVLRCLGAPSSGPLAVFVLQAAGMGLVGAFGGTVAGVGLQALLPQVLAALLPVPVRFRLDPAALLEGLVVGVAVAMLFAALPLLTLRRVSPLLALRMFASEAPKMSRDLARWIGAAAVAAGVCTVAVAQTNSWRVGLAISGSLAGVLVALAVVAALLKLLARRALPTTWPYPWRQGVANIYRPNNQTGVVMLTLGFGVFLIATLYLVQVALLDSVARLEMGGNPNLVLFDIQPDQVDGVRGILADEGLEVIQETPVVPMRLASVKGRPVAEIDESEIRPWVLRREYNSTYRAEVAVTEEIIDGEWVAIATTSQGVDSDPVPVSLEEGIAERLQVSVGDLLEFDVQGVPVMARVASLRIVDWEQVRPNFFVVFPTGVLEPAPQQIVVVSRASGPQQSAAVQRRVVERYTNVAMMDLGLILASIDAVLAQVSLALRFMAGLSVLSGLVVLVVAVLSSRYQRLRESVLLRTLGASRSQIVQILTVEYFALGLLAALTGLVLALGASWALSRWLFEVPFKPVALPLIVLLVVVVSLTLGVGLLGSRGATRRPPLEVLRAEL